MCPADGAFLGLRQGLVARAAGTHVTTLQEHTGALLAQAHRTAGGGHAAFLDVEFTHTLLLTLLELLEHAPLLLLLSVVHVLFPQDEEQHGTGGDAEHNSQTPPEFDAVRLLPQKRLVVQTSEEIAEALLGRLELEEVVVQHQLSHACDALSQTQHLLSFVDALRPFAADEVAYDAGQRLDCGVEVLIGGLQVQLGGIEGTYDPHCSSDVFIMRPEGERDRVDALVDDFLCVVPVHTHTQYKQRE